MYGLEDRLRDLYLMKEIYTNLMREQNLASRFQHQNNNPQKERIESLDTIKMETRCRFGLRTNRHFYAMTVQDNPRLLWCSLLLLVPILWFNLSSGIILVEYHCNIAQCDFVRHYLPQAEQSHSWFYPPLLAFLLVPFKYF